MSYERDAFIRHFASRGSREIVVVKNATGHIIRTTMPRRKAGLMLGSVLPLVTMARNAVRDLDPSNDLTFLRMRSDIRETMVSADKHVTLIVIQNFEFKQRERNF